MNLLTFRVANGMNDPEFDLNFDGQVDFADMQVWLVDAGAWPGNVGLTGGNPFLFGDADLNGVVDGADFLAWNDNKFTMNTDWSAGNFNGDMFVDATDFVIWNGNKFQSSMAPGMLLQMSPEESKEREYSLEASQGQVAYKAAVPALRAQQIVDFSPASTRRAEFHESAIDRVFGPSSSLSESGTDSATWGYHT